MTRTAQSTQTVTNQDLTVMKIYHNDEPGPNWKPKVYDGVEQPFEPNSKVIAVPYGSPENAQQLEFKVKPAKFWMRGILRQGRSFTCSVKSGTTNGHPWSNLEDIVAELTADGNMKRIPDSAKTPGGAKPPAPAAPAASKPPAPAAPAKPAAAAPSKAPVPAAKAPEEPPKPRPKPNEKFIEYCFTPQTNAFFRMQDGFTEDNIVLGQAQNMAFEAARFELGWGNQARIVGSMEGEPLEGKNATEHQLQESIKKWSLWFEWYLSERRWNKIRERLNNLLKNCLTKDQVIACVEMAWAKLPESHYDLIREQARKRLEEILNNNPKNPDASQPTATPEVFEPKDWSETTGPSATASAEDLGEKPSAPATPPGPDMTMINFTIAALNKIEILEAEKLEKFWSTTIPALRAVPEVMAAYEDAKTRADIPF